MVFSFFRPSFETSYAKATASTDPQEILKHLRAALKAAGNDLDKAGVALFTIGDVLGQLAHATGDAELQERARISTAQGLTMVNESRLPRLIASGSARLGLATGLAEAEVVSACWEIDSLAKLREGDVQGCVTALQGATSTLSVAFGRDNPKMLGPLWRCMARLMGTSVAELSHVVAQLGQSGLRILGQHPDAPVDDALWILNYAAAASAAQREKEKLVELLQRIVTLADANGRATFAEKAKANLTSLSSPSPRLTFAVAAEELAELRHRGEVV